MQDYFTNVKITQTFIDDLNNWDSIYGFKFKGYTIDDIAADVTNWLAFEFDQCTKQLKLIIGTIGELVVRGEIYYGIDSVNIDRKAFSFDIDSILTSTYDDEGNGKLYNNLIIDLSSWNISTEFKSMATNIGKDYSDAVIRFDEEHFHYTNEKMSGVMVIESTDQYDPTLLLNNLQSNLLINDKVNTPKSEGTYISDSDGFYQDGESLLKFEFNGIDTDFLLKINLEEIYHMNDYRVNLLGKEVTECTDYSRSLLNGLVLDKPDNTEDRKLTYVNLPNQFIFHNQTLSSGSLRDVLASGIYRIPNGSNISDSPLDFTSTFSGMLFVQPLGNNRFIQVVIGFNQTSSYQFRRFIDGTLITSWVENIDRVNLNKYITFDLIIRNATDLANFINNPNNYNNVAFVGDGSLGSGGYDLTGLGTLTISSMVGFGATITVNNLISNGSTVLRDLNIKYTRTSSGSGGSIISGFKSVDNIVLTPIISSSASATALSSCAHVNNVLINSSAINGTFVTANSCNFMSNVRYSDLNMSINYTNCNYVDPYTCAGVTRDADYLGNRPSSCWYSTNIVNSWAGGDLSFGVSIVNNMTDAPEGIVPGSYPLIINTDIGLNVDGTSSGSGAQYILSSDNHRWVRLLNDGTWGDWHRLLVDGDDEDLYNIYAKRSLYGAPITIADFNNLNSFIQDIKVMDTVGFYSSSPVNGPWGSNEPVWGKICRQEIGYTAIATNGIDLAIGKHDSINVTWNYMSAGITRYAPSSIKSTKNNRYVQLTAGLNSIAGKYIKLSFPLNLSGIICVDLTIGYDGCVISGNIYGSYSSGSWSSTYGTFNSDRVKSVTYSTVEGVPTIFIETNSTATKLIKADLISSREIVLDNDFISASAAPTGGVVGVINTTNSAYNVTNQIAGNAITDIFSGTKAKNALGLTTEDKKNSDLYLVGVTTTSGGTAYIRTDLKVNANGKLNALAFNSMSALEAKENVKEADFNALELIDNTKIVKFNFKGSSDEMVGFIANNTNKILSGENHDSMDMYNCQGTTFKAIQELHKIIKSQSEEIKKLKDSIKEN